MKSGNRWRRYWETQASNDRADFDADRGRSALSSDFEDEAQKELMEFAAIRPDDLVLDAGCGTGSNLCPLRELGRRVVGMDYSEGMTKRAKGRMTRESACSDVDVLVGSISEAALRTATFDRVICISVLQYLDNDECRKAFREFRRIVRDDGELVLHVKNLASLYLSTLVIAKKLRSIFGKKPKLEYYRSFRWYADLAEHCGFEVVKYHSHNIFVIDFLPRRLYFWLVAFERKHYTGSLFRRFGADYFLRLRATSIDGLGGGGGAIRR